MIKKCLHILLLVVFASSFLSFASAQDTSSLAVMNKAMSSYKLRPLDLIEVRVFQEQDLTRIVRIVADGTIDMPLIGRIEIVGLTVPQAQEKIKALYDKDYLVNSQISIYITEYSPRRVHVMGMVLSPGEVRFPNEETMTFTKALASVGGVAPKGDSRNIKLKRTLPDGSSKTYVLDLKDIMRDPKSADILLEEGDLIYVEENIW